MRYVDADKLIAHLKDEMKECHLPFGSRSGGKGIAYGTILGLKSAISFVETLATVDVVSKEDLKDILMKKKACVPPSLPSDVVREIEVRARKEKNDMARYIDADELYETVTKKYSDIVAGCYPYNIVAYDMARLVKEAPTADVVPKSEYDCLEKLYNDMTQEAKGYLSRLYGIRADVAREIFAEIDNFLIKTVGEFDKALDKAIREDKYGLASLYSDEKNLVITLKIAIAELKKKYTGDQS